MRGLIDRGTSASRRQAGKDSKESGHAHALREKFNALTHLAGAIAALVGTVVLVVLAARLTEEELKHQEMFRRLEAMMAPGVPEGYRFLPHSNEVAGAVLGACTRAVLAPICDIELFSQAHCRSSIEPETRICPLWKDVFLFH